MKVFSLKNLVMIVLLVFSVNFFPQSFASAATVKLGDACKVKDANTVVNGVNFHCAVDPTKWATSTKLIWQNAEKWSASVDKVLSTLSGSARYDYCIVQAGGPLPGKKGQIPSSAIAACQRYSPNAKNSSNGKSSSGTTTTSSWPAFMTQEYLDCLANNGFKPKVMGELMSAITQKTNTPALDACNSIAPDFVRNFKLTSK